MVKTQSAKNKTNSQIRRSIKNSSMRDLYGGGKKKRLSKLQTVETIETAKLLPTVETPKYQPTNSERKRETVRSNLHRV